MSFAGQVAMSAANAAASNMHSQVGQAIGKPLENLSGSKAANHAEINWVDFNYPPFVRLIHYRVDELPTTLTGIVRMFNISFLVTVLACLLNFIDTIIIVGSSDAPFKWVVQSGIHLLILPACALATFYCGYRGLCEPDATLASRFKMAQPILALIYFFMAIVPFGCAHGLAEFSKIDDHTQGQGSGFWTVAIIVESCLWGGNTALAALNSVRAAKYDMMNGDGGPLTGRF
eukprot:CAMPEP_0206475582 /NCGR_PEP_ID=MMETSP0324_2-20121206/34174_1 /ASSEMBLY_ACC=CAM_ASM_000836 /TAXON_ID=2866 /ORGANISM="Crypthecodinium cohnii, Strain Seligo" /LENGTH=230 /DNA_ID=CAMNT_0053950985 /DNA_START=68 /DNA_END=760 /DNA_ORIENTATION=-